MGNTVSIPEEELSFIASRSSGPGGQHVNKVSTRVTLLFDIDQSSSLTDKQKRRVKSRLANRVSKKGILQVVSQRHRSQAANRRAALEKLGRLLDEALRESRPRVKTSVPEKARRRRRDQKRLRSRLKKLRSRTVSEDE
jgi:ribosome-associated protein